MKYQINFLKFLQDYNITYMTSGNKHCRPGWVQIGCPFCAGGAGTHLGIHLSGVGASCWRCKGKSIRQIIQALLKCSYQEVCRIESKYRTRLVVRRKVPSSLNLALKVELPSGTGPMNARHDIYLEERKFDPEHLERVFGLKGTGPIGSYKHRIIAPILFHDRLISYIGRDITGKADLRYKACPTICESYPYKKITYGIELAKKESVLIVEGITDVWRLGPGSVATFGTAFTPAQVRLLASNFKRAFVFFDNEVPAQRASRELGLMLATSGIEVEILVPESDPGNMDQNEADNLVKELFVR